MLLPITTTYAAAAGIINIGLAVRVMQLRFREQVSHGDGGRPLLARRMRAQANFIEYTPLILILCGLIELATGGSSWLWALMGIYILARLGHALGMDGDLPGLGRKAGLMLTVLTTLILAGVALYTVWYPAA